MNRLIILFLASSALFLGSCSNGSKSEASTSNQSEVLPDDFWDFLDEFHTDVEFQKAHIQWPLQGIPTLMDSRDSTLVTETYRWIADEWIMHHDFDESNEEFELNYSMVGDAIIIEQIIHINGSMGMERRFAKQEDSWMLIYYAGMNLIRQ